VKIRRTGAGRGQAATWYVWADQPEEQAAIRAGLLEDRSPDNRVRYVLAWGFPNRRGAEKALENLRPKIEELTSRVGGDLLLQRGREVEARILTEDVHLDVCRTELRVLINQLQVLADELNNARLIALAGEMDRWLEEEKRLWLRAVNAMQMACMLCVLYDEQTSYSDSEKPQPQANSE